ncbi:MAG: dicarboxylate/amino acid:cation symporter [Holosporales bacterium]|jgi:Na+/H+-dicarboxylate symporter|nr:dicarboxylate/amino acid:cation symporter [Holosporales bacterium]
MLIRKFLNLPFFVLALFVLVLTFGEHIESSIKSHLYAVSLCLKDAIIFILPIVIFSFVLNGILNLKNESIKIILILVPLVCLSNFFGFWISYIFTTPILKTGIVTISKLSSENALLPAWKLSIPHFVKNDISLLMGVLIGIIGNFVKSNFINRVGDKLEVLANFILKKAICPILPLFVLGFIVKMQYEGTLSLMIREYALLLVIVTVLAYSYMFIIMFFLSDKQFGETIKKFKNLLPSILLGLFSMSSAAAIPSTIEGSEKNLKNKNIARFVVPAAANMHLLGDCFAIPIIGLALMISFGRDLPTFGEYFVFTLYGVVAKFAAAGIPGGSALIFAPIFENVFDFSAPMLTAITAIYVLFDPIATSANVFGHGVFAMLFEKLCNKAIKGRRF